MEEYVRVRLPREGEILGEIEEALGGSRFNVKCKDGINRVCRIPGRFRKKTKIRAGDAVIVKPWSVENDKGDIVWAYNKTHANWLRKKGYI